MSDTQDRDSRTEAPTGRRLAQAREKGDVVKSAEVASTCALAATCLLLLLQGPELARSTANALLPFIAHAGSIDLTGRGALVVLREALRACAPGFLALGVAAAAGAAGAVAQTGVIFAPDKLRPNFGKLNPMSGFAALFGLDGLINFAKSLVKLIAMVAVAFGVLKPHAYVLEGMSALAPGAILPATFDIVRRLVVAALLVFTVAAAVDYFIQRQRFMDKMKMSREDIKHETKDSEGDPHIKARLKQQRMARARTRMVAAVPKATLVIMNPTHYAVALRYVQGETPAPICVAKGLDAVALKIREIAEEHNIPVIEEPPLARALYAVVEVDETIPREHYQAVARIVGFILNAGRRRARPLRASLPGLR